MKSITVQDIKGIIVARIEHLNIKNKHCVINLDDTGEMWKVHHTPGNEQWCTDCARIQELKKLLKEL